MKREVLLVLLLLAVALLAAVDTARAGGDNAKTEDKEKTKTEVREGDEAHDIFCKCNLNYLGGTAHGLAELCPGISRQCRRSFCKPLCLRMAWKPKLHVDCEQAKGWNWCPKFAAQVRRAARAVTSQFQAFTCLDLHFCNETTNHISTWVENHSFGNHFPKHKLPIDACSHADATVAQKETLCDACERVVSVEIERGQCLPQFKVFQEQHQRRNE
eukprot:TRINITY_DN66623_c7_g2_i1.p1 TRINITY_DN66623_c7_g2~~TRINITY_DN66623_c7_g2_i1.p1  ORF type:complete len:223 (+),score=101.64 TRINITY_DN66623_c7_g2_i1:25-669(+)